ncbi:MAG: transcriptional repressor [Arenicellales bacterium]|nr:transcriptional repressor [Arenicellales bacterium]
MNKKQLGEIISRAESLCNQRGVRFTSLRKRVFTLLCTSDKPLSAYEILDLLRTSTTNPAPPTVYRTLDFLLQQRLAHKLESRHAFVGCSHPEHPHSSQFLICGDCGDVNEIDNSELIKNLASTEKKMGFKTRRSVVEFLGTCAECLNK